MLRRLYFLFPDEERAQKLIDELMDFSITKSRIHTITQSNQPPTLSEAIDRDKKYTAHQIEKILWSSNLILFGLALIILIASLFMTEWIWFGLAIVVMLVTFFIGQQFVIRVPDDHLTDFTDALAHGEVLLMVDVPLHRMSEIKNFVQHRHPEATGGGAGWATDAFGLQEPDRE